MWCQRKMRSETGLELQFSTCKSITDPAGLAAIDDVSMNQPFGGGGGGGVCLDLLIIMI